jgi:hypothetical protein
MEIDFFHDEGPHGLRTETWTNEYEYVTGEGEGLFERLVHTRGFLYGARDAGEEHNLAESLWRAAQSKMPASYSDRLRTGPITTALPGGTKLWLKLGPLPSGTAWGLATLSGTSMTAAWSEISKYLLAGAAELAHANPTDLLEHIINTPLRQANAVTRVSAGTLGKSLTGQLYFRARFFVKGDMLPVAPDASGRTVLVEWIRQHNATMFQLRLALNAFRHDLALMGDDLMMLGKVNRVLRALYDIGNLVVIRKGDWFGNYNPLVHDASFCERAVILPSLPGGRFGFTWGVRDTPITKALLDQRRDAVAQYKRMRDAYRKYPAMYVSLVNEACALETDILSALVIDGQVADRVHPEIQSALQWLGSATGGDAPDDAQGLGVLLSMIFADLPPELDPPTNVIRLASTAMILDGLLSDHDEASRGPLETRVKNALATTMALPSNLRSKLLKRTGWDDLLDAYSTATGLAKKASYADKAAIRATEVPGAITTAKAPLGQFLRRASKLKLDLFDLSNAVAVLRAVGFVVTGIGIVDDVVKLGGAATGQGDVSDAFERLTKDSISAFGSLARDYYGTRAQIRRMSGSLSDAEAKSLKALEERFKQTGNLLGVVSGVWTAAAGVNQRNTLLTGAGLANVLGYGLRRLGMREALVAVVGFDVTLPLLIVGAGLELLNALGPAKADALMRKESVNMLHGVVELLRGWYNRHPPWRPETSADFEEALKNVEDMIQDVDDEEAWRPMLPYSDGDAGVTRARLVDIGFSSAEAAKLIPTESVYWLRGTPPTALDPRFWPPNWPDFATN